jgi:hypothetical protein
VSDLFDGYGEPGSGLLRHAFDEVIDPSAAPRSGNLDFLIRPL